MASSVLNSKTIILVGTSPTDTETFGKSLINTGCTIKHFNSSSLATTGLSKHTFDALVMVPSKGGYPNEQETRVIDKARENRCPILILISNTSENPAEQVLQWQADDYLLSPIDPAIVVLRLSIHFKHKELLAQCETKVLHQSEQQLAMLHRIANNIPLPFAITDCKGEIKFINIKFTELFGFELEEIPTVELWYKKTFPNAVMRKIAYSQWKKRPTTQDANRAEHQTNEYTLFSKSGSRHILEIYTEKFDSICYIIFHDITRQKHDLQEIRKLSEAIYQNPASIVITDQRGDITFVNPTFSQNTGYASDEVIGLNLRLPKSGVINSSLYSEIWHTITSGKIWNGEFLNQKKNGENLWEKAVAAPIFDEEGKTINYIIIKEDITKTQQALQELVNSEQALKDANATKDKFFSIIAHDLRNPIGAIRNLASIMMKTDSNNPDYQAYLQQIYNSAANTSDLLEDLLNWARSQTGKLASKPVVFNLRKEINNVSTSMENLVIAKKITLTIDIQPIAQVFADIGLFHTVIRNLLSNAIKFTNEKGEITIDATDNQKYIMICIADNGVGIENERLSELFFVERNYSTTGTAFETGTGMGLPLCKEFATKMGGEIWIESQLGSGTQVYFAIPAYR